VTIAISISGKSQIYSV